MTWCGINHYISSLTLSCGIHVQYPVRLASLAAEEEWKMNSLEILMLHTSTPNPRGQRIWLQFVFNFHGLFATPVGDISCAFSSAGGFFKHFTIVSTFQIGSGFSTGFVVWSNYRLTSNLKSPNSRLWGRTMWSWSKTYSKSWVRSHTAVRPPTSSCASLRSLTSRSGLIVACRHVG